jgi:large conductance mechanosensitive channel
MYVGRRFIGETIKRTRDEIESGIEFVIGEKEFSEWKSFAFKGQMIQMAIAFILGAAFTKAVKAISDCILMPLINYGLLLTGEDWRKWTVSPVENLNIEVGAFLSAFVDFLLISIVLYIMYRKVMRPLFDEEKKAKTEIKCIETRDCPSCFEKIHWKATKCPSCTGDIASCTGDIG